jgi:hypothetical protein
MVGRFSEWLHREGGVDYLQQEEERTDAACSYLVLPLFLPRFCPLTLRVSQSSAGFNSEMAEFGAPVPSFGPFRWLTLLSQAVKRRARSSNGNVV